jgi:S-DNA-T family DNA segregation ATPase FtsK/SpoIIIE
VVVVTGVIKTNIPTRIAFEVADAINSRTILDCMGAEKLLGKGDMLFLPPGSPRTTRIQGALITDNELTSILNFISEQAKPNFFEDFLRQLSQPDAEEGEQEDEEDEDLIQKSVDVIYTRNRASVSMLQRDLKLGYNRAARIMEILERRGIIGPSRGSKDREIL